MAFEELLRMADLELWKMLSRTFPGLVLNVRVEHYYAVGWWYTFELVNDPRRQTWAVRESDIDNAARA